MERAVVQERRRDQSPPVAVRDGRPEEDALLVDLAADAVDVSAGDELEQVDQHVRRDQRPGHDAAGPLVAGAANPAGDARDALRLA